MSCEILSMITRYPLGSAIFTPPSFTNSACTPSTFMLLMRSTRADGKVFSIPKIIPIFFIRPLLPPATLSCVPAAAQWHPRETPQGASIASDAHPYSALAKVFYRHPLPPRPVMLHMIAPNIQPVSDSLTIQHVPQLHVVVQADVPFASCQHDLHLPVAAEKPVIIHVRQIIGRTIEITIIVVISIQKLVDIERPAHAHTSRYYIRMLERKIDRMISPETAPRHRQLPGLILPAHKRQQFMQDVSFILQMPQHTHPRMHSLVVPTLAIH